MKIENLLSIYFGTNLFLYNVSWQQKCTWKRNQTKQFWNSDWSRCHPGGGTLRRPFRSEVLIQRPEALPADRSRPSPFSGITLGHRELPCLWSILTSRNNPLLMTGYCWSSNLSVSCLNSGHRWKASTASGSTWDQRRPLSASWQGQ